jgi:hypothetical protein
MKWKVGAKVLGMPLITALPIVPRTALIIGRETGIQALQQRLQIA